MSAERLVSKTAHRLVDSGTRTLLPKVVSYANICLCQNLEIFMFAESAGMKARAGKGSAGSVTSGILSRRLKLVFLGDLN